MTKKLLAIGFLFLTAAARDFEEIQPECAANAAACTERQPMQIVNETGIPGEGEVLAIDGLWAVRGINHMRTTLTRQNGGAVAETTVSDEGPATAFMAIPMLSGWQVGYGPAAPADGEPRPDEEDRYLGHARVEVRVVGIRLEGGRTIADISVRARLSDKNADDPWWARVSFYVLFVGHPSA